MRCMTGCGVVGMKRLWSNSRGQRSTHHNDDLWHVVFHGLDHGAVLRSHLGHLRTTPVLSTRHGEFQPVPLVPQQLHVTLLQTCSIMTLPSYLSAPRAPCTCQYLTLPELAHSSQ